jgi:ketosteroid isomerase-like protein
MPEPTFATPEQAETAFYRAFETLDLSLMQQVWGAGAEVACLHPGGDLLLGAPAVLASWRQILQGARPPSLQFRRLQAQGDAATRVHLVEELISPSGGAEDDSTRVLATNVYRREGEGWRLQLHHASLPMVRPQEAVEKPDRQLH